jgi:hypothetical protein
MVNIIFLIFFLDIALEEKLKPFIANAGDDKTSHLKQLTKNVWKRLFLVGNIELQMDRLNTERGIERLRMQESLMGKVYEERCKIIFGENNKGEIDDEKALPVFWLTVFKLSGLFCDLIQMNDEDEKAFSYLRDVKIAL